MSDESDPLVLAARAARERYQDCERRYSEAGEPGGQLYEELWNLRFEWTQAVTAMCRKPAGQPANVRQVPT